MGFLGSSPLDIQRTLGKSLFDSEGRYKDPVGAYKELYSLLRRDPSKGGRGLDAERTRLAFQSSMGMEAGSAMYNALASGKFRDVKSLSGASGTARRYNEDYLNSSIGRVDLKDVNAYFEKMDFAKPMAELRDPLLDAMGKHPGLAALAGGAAVVGLRYGLPALGKGIAGSGAGALALSGVSMMVPSDTPRPKTEQIAEKIYGEAHGKMKPLFNWDPFGERAEINEAKKTVAAQGVDISTASAEQIEAALKRALESSTVKVQVQDNGNLGAETENDKSAEGRN
jgi:hypothetical protein